MNIWKVVVVAVLASASLTVAPAPADAAVTYRRVMPLGDSITWGLGNGYDSYRADLSRRLWSNGYPVNYVGSCPNATFAAWKCPYAGRYADREHEGHSGWRIDQMTPHVDNLIKAFQPDVVLIELGTNDIAQQYQLATAPDRLGALVDRIRVLRPTAHIFVGAVVRSTKLDQAAITAYNEGVATMVAGKSSSHVHFVPLNMVGSASDLYDGVHPNACGYAKMGYVWWYFMRKVFGPTWPQKIANPFSTGCPN